MTITRFALVFLACIAWEAPIASSADDPNSAEVSELAYFAASDGWGDPDKQGRFRNIKISETSFTTINGQYSSLIEVIETEKLANLEGVGIFFEDYFPDEEREGFVKLLRENGVSEIVTNRDDAWSKARRLYLARTTGTLVGTITAAETGEPLPGAFVSSQFFGDDTDESGEYKVIYLDPGTEVISASRRDRKTQSVEIEFVAGKSTKRDFVLELATPACCALEGEWEIELRITDDRRSPESLPDEVANTVAGTLRFSDVFKDPLLDKSEYEDSINDEFGEYKIDLTPFFGENITASVSNTIFPGSNQLDILTQAMGMIYDGNRVSIDFIPRMSHGGISLSGIISENEVVEGRWVKRDLAVMLSGEFSMKRSDKPSARMVALANVLSGVWTKNEWFSEDDVARCRQLKIFPGAIQSAHSQYFDTIHDPKRCAVERTHLNWGGYTDRTSIVELDCKKFWMRIRLVDHFFEERGFLPMSALDLKAFYSSHSIPE
jgi:hypothetical protein